MQALFSGSMRGAIDFDFNSFFFHFLSFSIFCVCVCVCVAAFFSLPLMFLWINNFFLGKGE